MLVVLNDLPDKPYFLTYGWLAMNDLADYVSTLTGYSAFSLVYIVRGLADLGLTVA